MFKIFSVYDSKADAFVQPFFSTNESVAIRDFARAASDPSTGFFHNPSDYTLFEIGTWDGQSGVLSIHDAKISLGTALQHKKESS